MKFDDFKAKDCDKSRFFKTRHFTERLCGRHGLTKSLACMIVFTSNCRSSLDSTEKDIFCSNLEMFRAWCRISVASIPCKYIRMYPYCAFHNIACTGWSSTCIMVCRTSTNCSGVKLLNMSRVGDVLVISNVWYAWRFSRTLMSL